MKLTKKQIEKLPVIDTYKYLEVLKKLEINCCSHPCEVTAINKYGKRIISIQEVEMLVFSTGNTVTRNIHKPLIFVVSK